VIWATLLLICSRVCSKGITEIFLKPKWIIEGTWKIAQREKKDRYGSFTLKKKNEIEGLTIPEQLCSWRLSEFYATYIIMQGGEDPRAALQENSF